MIGRLSMARPTQPSELPKNLWLVEMLSNPAQHVQDYDLGAFSVGNNIEPDGDIERLLVIFINLIPLGV
jgi:hypothetical protein